MIHKTPGYVSLIETERAPLTDEVIKSIVEAAGCNEEWLRDGSGKICDIPPADIEGIRQRVLQVRKQNGLSQKKFADKMNIPKTQIGDIELGKIKVRRDWLWKVSEVFNVNFYWLLTGVEVQTDDVEGEIAEIEVWYRNHPEERKAMIVKIREARDAGSMTTGA